MTRHFIIGTNKEDELDHIVVPDDVIEDDWVPEWAESEARFESWTLRDEDSLREHVRAIAVDLGDPIQKMRGIITGIATGELLLAIVDDELLVTDAHGNHCDTATECINMNALDDAT